MRLALYAGTHPRLSEVSSSRLKELARQGRDLSRHCPAQVAARLGRRVTRGSPRTAEAAHG